MFRTTIDGFPLIIEKKADQWTLSGDPDKKIYDGENAAILNWAISLVTNMLDSNSTNWTKILEGEGVTYGVAGCVPADKYQIDPARAIRYYTHFFKKAPDSPMWYIFSDEITTTKSTFIPYNALKSILELAIDLHSGKTVPPIGN